MSVAIKPNADDGATYERDYAAWIDAQVAHLRAKRFAALDLLHLIDEVESLAKSDKRALKSEIERCIVHLLKWQHQPLRRGASWRGTIRDARKKAGDIIEDSPSLYRFLLEGISELYLKARATAADETRMPASTFPEILPYRLEQILDLEFLPGPEDSRSEESGTLGSDNERAEDA